MPRWLRVATITVALPITALSHEAKADEAKPDEIAAIFNEIELPSLLAMRRKVTARKAPEAPTLTKNSLKDYADDKPTFDEIRKDPDQYANQLPLRVAAFEAIVEMRKLKFDAETEKLPEEFQWPISDATKKEITEKHQRAVARRIAVLDEWIEKLEEAGKGRAMEKSKRWLAHFDYAHAEARLRLAYLTEYNLALGHVKIEKLPDLGKNQKGWRLAISEEMNSAQPIRELAEKAMAAFVQIAKDYPDTPWAVLAKQQRQLALGLTWKASGLGANKE